MYLEIFSGSGRLTASFRRVGCTQSCGIDHVVPKRVQAPTICLDLASDSGMEALVEMLEHPCLVYVHAAPPCGTASRAREVKAACLSLCGRLRKLSQKV